MAEYRSLWRGSLSFGLVNVPVKLYSAVERQGVSFRYIHRLCHTPIRYKKACPKCDREVSQEEIALGYEIDRGKYVLLFPEELEQLPLPTARTIEILDFVGLQEIDPVFYDHSYYLEPTDGGSKAYGLLREALNQTGRVAIGRVALRSRESLAVVRTSGRTLVLSTMFYPSEVRPAEKVVDPGEALQPTDRELQMAIQLIEALSAPFDPARYTSRYREALHELIRRKAAEEPVEAPAAAPAAQVVDLMAALEASLAAARKADGRVPAPVGGG